MCLIRAEIVTVLLAPLLVLRCEGFLRDSTNTLTMPEICHKIHPLLAAIGTGRTAEKAVCVRESGIQQGNQVVLESGLYLGILPVLPIAILQHKPGIVRWDVFRQRKPVIQTIVGQLHSVFLIGLGSPQTVVPVVMHQHCIDH